MKQKSILFIALLTTLIFSCQNNAPVSHKTDHLAGDDSTSLRKEIELKNRQFAQAHILRDTAFLNNIFTNDARVFSPNSEIIQGRHAIAAINAEYVNFGISLFDIQTTRLYGEGNYLINEGNYTMSYGKDNTTEKGKFIFIWKMVNGEWKLDSDIWNSSMSAAPSK
jgi:ketosteroid isomerase-like protein